MSAEPELTEAQRESIANALYAGRKIEAIKQFRELSGLDLKESKDIVDRLEATLRRVHPEKFSVTRSSGLGCLVVLALLIGGAVLLVILLRQ